MKKSLGFLILLTFTSAAFAGTGQIGSVDKPSKLICEISYSWPKEGGGLNFDRKKISIKTKNQKGYLRNVANAQYTTADGRFLINMHGIQANGDTFISCDQVGIFVTDLKTNTQSSPGMFPTGRKEYCRTTQSMSIMPEIEDDKAANGLDISCSLN